MDTFPLYSTIINVLWSINLEKTSTLAREYTWWWTLKNSIWKILSLKGSVFKWHGLIAFLLLSLPLSTLLWMYTLLGKLLTTFLIFTLPLSLFLCCFLWGVSIWTFAFWAYYRLFLFTFHPFMQASFTTVTIDYNFNFSHDYIILHIPVLPSWWVLDVYRLNCIWKHSLAPVDLTELLT